jgi:hypothetical protein
MNRVKVAGFLAVAVMILFSGVLVSQARAEDWKLFYKDADESKEYYFDKTSIVRPEPLIVRVWQKVVEIDTKKDTKSDLWKARVEINCSNRKFLLLADNPDEPELKKAKESSYLSEKKLSKDPALQGNILWALQENVCP